MNTTPTEPVRIGVVGLGNFGRLHALTLAGLAEANLVALVDVNQSRLDEIHLHLPTVPRWSTLDEALPEAKAEAWVMATRTESHIPLAAKILAAEGFALIEKPLAESTDSAKIE